MVYNNHKIAKGVNMIIPINLNNTSYDVIIERGILDKIEEYLIFPQKTLIITDNNIPNEYTEKVIKKKNDIMKYVIESGEISKNLLTYQEIIAFLVKNNFSRDDLIIALGGGVVGDLAGFVAATYKRGCRFVNIPTSTLAMVDSSIGGKVALDFERFKNVIGCFYQPEKVIIDLNVLKTLPKRHYNNGLIEALKAGLVGDSELFDLFLKNEYIDKIEDVVVRSLLVKKRIVEEDPYDRNIRKYLNFGHTIGHAIESSYFDEIYHGEEFYLWILNVLIPELKKEV